MFVLQDVENAEVRETAREAAAQRENHAGGRICAGNVSLRGAVAAFSSVPGFDESCHNASLARRYALGNEAEVLNARYSRTLS